MNETPLQQQFQKIAAGLAGDAQVRDVEALLSLLQASAQALREDGFAAELEVRPYQYKCGLQANESVWANATLSIDGVGLEFIVADNGKGRARLHGNLGPVRVFDADPPAATARSGPQSAEGLKDELVAIALRVKAANDHFGAYGVDSASPALGKAAGTSLRAGLRPGGGAKP